MRELHQLLKRLASKKDVEWIAEGNSIAVRLSVYDRQQRIRVECQDNQYVFSTVVSDATSANRTRAHRRHLAIRAWTRNAKTELVNFTFDESGRLVGEIRHLANHLDPAELDIYLKLLATEGDRFEYVLTGGDEH